MGWREGPRLLVCLKWDWKLWRACPTISSRPHGWPLLAAFPFLLSLPLTFFFWPIQLVKWATFGFDPNEMLTYDIIINIYRVRLANSLIQFDRLLTSHLIQFYRFRYLESKEGNEKELHIPKPLQLVIYDLQVIRWISSFMTLLLYFWIHLIYLRYLDVIYIVINNFMMTHVIITKTYSIVYLITIV